VKAGAVAAVTAGGYLVGSIQFARIVFALRAPGEPIPLVRTPTTDGAAELVSGNIGGTNVMIAFGPRWGMFVTSLDMAKAFVPVLALKVAYPGKPYSLICGVAVLVGHVWPVRHRFHGGGGNSVVLGLLLAVSPGGAVVTHLGGMALGKVWPALGFLAGVGLTIPWFAWRNGLRSPKCLFAMAMTAVYVAGQLPDFWKGYQLLRQGYTFDTGHVMEMMRGSARTGRTGAEISEERRGGRSGAASSAGGRDGARPPRPLDRLR
jgi:acyl phosphate:glycerol-3-phosphate acyltransferase